MADISKYFGQGVKNTLYLKNGVNFYHKGPWIQVFENTEIDRWYVGDFASANYQVSAEFGSNKKETLQILVVARPDQANYTVYGRVSIDDPLVNINVSVNNGYLSLKMSVTDPSYRGTKVIFIASYAGTVNTLIPASELSFLIPDNLGSGAGGGGNIGGGGSGTVDLSNVAQSIVPDATNQYNIGTNNKRWKNVYVNSSIDIGGVPLSKSTTGSGLDFPLGSTIGGLPLGIFSKVSVPGADDVLADSETSTLTLAAGSNVIITTDPATKTVTISSSGGGGGSVISGGNSFQTITVAGQANVVAERANDVLTLVAGSGITISTNAASDSITISSTGGGGGGGGSSNQIIVTPTTTGEYPLVVANGLDTITPQSLYGKASLTLDLDNDVLNATAVSSRWADLAERYLADKSYEPGTILEFGGKNEVTLAENETRKVAGVVSSDPGFIMNRDLKDENSVLIALQGRVPCKVKGPIKKGDLIVSAGDGYAKSCSEPKIGSVIGKSLEDFSGEVGTIEIAVGRL